jgi:hypothetical protein
MGRKRNIQQQDLALENYTQGYNLIKRHPMFSPLLYHVHDVRKEGNLCPENGWAVITKNGFLHVHPKRRGEPLEWAYIIAHCLLHLGLGHFQEKQDFIKWNTACDCFIAKFLSDMKLGRAPSDLHYAIDFSATTEERLYSDFLESGIPSTLSGFGTAGAAFGDMEMIEEKTYWGDQKVDWAACFAKGLSMAVTSAVNVAGGLEPFLGAAKDGFTAAIRAKNWFISSYPLLGALAASFAIIEDPVLCTRMEISVAAVDAHMRHRRGNYRMASHQQYRAFGVRTRLFENHKNPS